MGTVTVTVTITMKVRIVFKNLIIIKTKIFEVM